MKAKCQLVENEKIWTLEDSNTKQKKISNVRNKKITI